MAKSKETEAPGYEPDTVYLFRLLRSVKLDGGRYGRADEHRAQGSLLNRLAEQEGDDVIDTAYAIE